MTLALDIGGTKIAAATIVDGRCIDRRQAAMPATEAEFLRAIERLCAGRPPPGKVGVAVTGRTDGRIVSSVNKHTISFWNDFPLRERLEHLLQQDVLVVNDAQAAAWGEYVVRDREACRTLLFMTLSTGVGGGFVIDGRLSTGVTGLGGHIGHTTTAHRLSASVLCGCGRIGCLETLASGTALARGASELFGRPALAQELFRLADAGHRDAELLLAQAANAVAEAIANCQALLDLEQVLIGGSVGLASRMVERIETSLRAMPALFHVPVAPARLGADAGLLGIGALVDSVASNRATE